MSSTPSKPEDSTLSSIKNIVNRYNTKKQSTPPTSYINLLLRTCKDELKDISKQSTKINYSDLEKSLNLIEEISREICLLTKREGGEKRANVRMVVYFMVMAGLAVGVVGGAYFKEWLLRRLEGDSIFEECRKY